MSSFLIGVDTISNLAETIAYICNFPSNTGNFHFIPDRLKETFKEAKRPLGYSERKIREMLFNMNHNALIERYGCNDMWWLGEKNLDDVLLEYIDGANNKINYRLSNNDFQFYKSLQCYLYQCTEGNMPNTELYKTLSKLELYIPAYIVSQMDEYKNAKWE